MFQKYVQILTFFHGKEYYVPKLTLSCNYVSHRHINLFVNWSKIYIKPSRKSDFREMEWDVALSWLLRGLRGNYVVYVAVAGCTW